MHRAVTLLLVCVLALATGARADGGASEEAASSAMDEQLSALKAQVMALRNRNKQLFEQAVSTSMAPTNTPPALATAAAEASAAELDAEIAAGTGIDVAAYYEAAAMGAQETVDDAQTASNVDIYAGANALVEADATVADRAAAQQKVAQLMASEAAVDSQVASLQGQLQSLTTEADAVLASGATAKAKDVEAETDTVEEEAADAAAAQAEVDAATGSEESAEGEAQAETQTEGEAETETESADEAADEAEETAAEASEDAAADEAADEEAAEAEDESSDSEDASDSDAESDSEEEDVVQGIDTAFAFRQAIEAETEGEELLQKEESGLKAEDKDETVAVDHEADEQAAEIDSEADAVEEQMDEAESDAAGESEELSADEIAAESDESSEAAAEESSDESSDEQLISDEADELATEEMLSLVEEHTRASDEADEAAATRAAAADQSVDAHDISAMNEQATASELEADSALEGIEAKAAHTTAALSLGDHAAVVNELAGAEMMFRQRLEAEAMQTAALAGEHEELANEMAADAWISAQTRAAMNAHIERVQQTIDAKEAELDAIEAKRKAKEDELDRLDAELDRKKAEKQRLENAPLPQVPPPADKAPVQQQTGEQASIRAALTVLKGQLARARAMLVAPRPSSSMQRPRLLIRPQSVGWYDAPRNTQSWLIGAVHPADRAKMKPRPKPEPWDGPYLRPLQETGYEDSQDAFWRRVVARRIPKGKDGKGMFEPYYLRWDKPRKPLPKIHYDKFGGIVRVPKRKAYIRPEWLRESRRKKRVCRDEWGYKVKCKKRKRVPDLSVVASYLPEKRVAVEYRDLYPDRPNVIRDANGQVLVRARTTSGPVRPYSPYNGQDFARFAQLHGDSGEQADDEAEDEDEADAEEQASEEEMDAAEDEDMAMAEAEHDQRLAEESDAIAEAQLNTEAAEAGAAEGEEEADAEDEAAAVRFATVNTATETEAEAVADLRHAKWAEGKVEAEERSPWDQARARMLHRLYLRRTRRMKGVCYKGDAECLKKAQMAEHEKRKRKVARFSHRPVIIDLAKERRRRARARAERMKALARRPEFVTPRYTADGFVAPELRDARRKATPTGLPPGWTVPLQRRKVRFA